METKTVIFDLGGVLVDVDFMRACRRFEALGATRAEKICERIATGPEKRALDSGRIDASEFTARFCAWCGLRLAEGEFARIWCDIFDEKSEVTALLEPLCAKAQLLLLSNTDPLHMEYLRKRYAFFTAFDAQILSYEIGASKPEALIFAHAQARVRPGNGVIYFDDVPEYVAAARACGWSAEQFVDSAKLRADLRRFGVA